MWCDDEKPVPGTQVLCDEAHAGAVAAVARDHDQLFQPRTRDAFAERKPAL